MCIDNIKCKYCNSKRINKCGKQNTPRMLASYQIYLIIWQLKGSVWGAKRLKHIFKASYQIYLIIWQLKEAVFDEIK